jgi:hypothetical protein
MHVLFQMSVLQFVIGINVVLCGFQTVEVGCIISLKVLVDFCEKSLKVPKG